MHEPYLLPGDRVAAEARIAELEQLIQDLGEDFRDAFTQSSETWHDNSPFEAVRDKQSMYAAELHQLRTLIRSSTLVAPKKKRATAGIGSLVTLENGKRYFIAGDWTAKAGRHEDDVYWVSCHTPVAKAVIGNKVGKQIIIAGRHETIRSISL